MLMVSNQDEKIVRREENKKTKKKQQQKGRTVFKLIVDLQRITTLVDPIVEVVVVGERSHATKEED